MAILIGKNWFKKRKHFAGAGSAIRGFAGAGSWQKWIEGQTFWTERSFGFTCGKALQVNKCCNSFRNSKFSSIQTFKVSKQVIPLPFSLTLPFPFSLAFPLPFHYHSITIFSYFCKFKVQLHSSLQGVNTGNSIPIFSYLSIPIFSYFSVTIFSYFSITFPLPFSLIFPLPSRFVPDFYTFIFILGFAWWRASIICGQGRIQNPFQGS